MAIVPRPARKKFDNKTKEKMMSTSQQQKLFKANINEYFKKRFNSRLAQCVGKQKLKFSKFYDVNNVNSIISSNYQNIRFP